MEFEETADALIQSVPPSSVAHLVTVCQRKGIGEDVLVVEQFTITKES